MSESIQQLTNTKDVIGGPRLVRTTDPDVFSDPDSARIAARNLGTQVHAIDLFPNEHDWIVNGDGTHSFAVEIGGNKYAGYTSQTVWDEPFQRDIAPVYSKDSNLQKQYQENIEAAGVADFVQTTRGNLQLFYDESKAGRYQLAFLDGDHSYQVVHDEINITEKLLAPGGVICFDDAHTVYEGVDAAIKSAILSQPHLWEGPTQLTRKLFFARKRISN